MHTILFIIKMLVAITGWLAALISLPLFFSFRWPAPAMWGLKVLVSALSPVLALIGLFTALVGLITGSFFVSLIGGYVFLVYAVHIICVTLPPDVSTGFDQAFGPNWHNNIPADQKAYFLSRRMVLRLPTVPKPRFEQNICFATLTGTGRQLFCDIWLPPANVRPSGMAFIYLHGGTWYLLDKDLGTRPFFSHLTAQGHVVMDVAYRLAPETDIMGMVQDVKRAIIWMKEHADIYRINPACIVIGGGSAGGHLALLTAYTATNPQFIPMELEGKDVSVCAVISLYGPADLEAMYYHTNQHLTTRSVPGRSKKAIPAKMPEWIIKKMGTAYYRLNMDKGYAGAGAFAPLLGGLPDECPERYNLFSPVMHVHPHCPPTLLIHGEHDIMAPVTATRSLYTCLVEEQVPTVLHILPQTDHGFDLALPKIAPAAHTAIYDVERFIALLAERTWIGENNTTATKKGFAASSTGY